MKLGRMVQNDMTNKFSPVAKMNYVLELETQEIEPARSAVPVKAEKLFFSI